MKTKNFWNTNIRSSKHKNKITNRKNQSGNMYVKEIGELNGIR